MISEVVTFPYGTAEGYPALRVDFEGNPFDAELADAEVKRHAGAEGIWAIWLDNIESWDAPELAPFCEFENVVALRKFEDRDWPIVAPWTVLDVSVMSTNLRYIDALAKQAAELVGPNPVVEDVVLVLEHGDPVPLAGALDLIDDIGAPAGVSYLYAPADHAGWPLLLRAVSKARSLWSLRRL